MKTVELKVTLQPQVLDTQGEALVRAVRDLGHKEIEEIRVGKILKLKIDETDETKIEETVKSLAERLFTNTVIETFEFEILEEE